MMKRTMISRFTRKQHRITVSETSFQTFSCKTTYSTIIYGSSGCVIRANLCPTLYSCLEAKSAFRFSLCVPYAVSHSTSADPFDQQDASSATSLALIHPPKGMARRIFGVKPTIRTWALEPFVKSLLIAACFCIKAALLPVYRDGRICRLLINIRVDSSAL